MNDLIKTRFQETGFCRLERGNTLQQILDLCNDLGIEPYEVHIGYDKGSVYLQALTSFKKEKIQMDKYVRRPQPRRYGNVAAQVRRNKEKHPEYYCSDPTCLWRTYNGQTGETTPCPEHERKV